MLAFVKENFTFFNAVNLVTTSSTGKSLSALGIQPRQLVSSGPLGKIIITIPPRVLYIFLYDE